MLNLMRKVVPNLTPGFRRGTGLHAGGPLPWDPGRQLGQHGAPFTPPIAPPV